MDALWVIIAIVAIVYRVLNKAGEITGEMKERLPESLGEKRLPPILKDWGFPWNEDNKWDEDDEYYTESPEKEVQSPQNTDNFTVMETSPETAVDTSLTSHQDLRDAGAAYHPLMDSSSLVNGLILSELLQPPKSKRGGRRF